MKNHQTPHGEDVRSFLRRHPFFSGLDDASLEQVVRQVIVRRMQRDEVILIEGDEPQAAYFIVHGRVRIYRMSPGGREQALMDLLPGAIFNLVPIIDGRPVVSNAVARTSGLLYAIRREDFLRLIRNYPSVAEAVLVDFCGRLRRLTGLVEDLALRTVPERLARLLLRMAESPAGKDVAPARFTQGELASQLGTVREVISRTLRQFEQQGLIRVERHQIIVLDREGLRQIACQLE